MYINSILSYPFTLLNVIIKINNTKSTFLAMYCYITLELAASFK